MLCSLLYYNKIFVDKIRQAMPRSIYRYVRETPISTKRLELNPTAAIGARNLQEIRGLKLFDSSLEWNKELMQYKTELFWGGVVQNSKEVFSSPVFDNCVRMLNALNDYHMSVRFPLITSDGGNKIKFFDLNSMMNSITSRNSDADAGVQEENEEEELNLRKWHLKIFCQCVARRFMAVHVCNLLYIGGTITWLNDKKDIDPTTIRTKALSYLSQNLKILNQKSRVNRELVKSFSGSLAAVQKAKRWLGGFSNSDVGMGGLQSRSAVSELGAYSKAFQLCNPEQMADVIKAGFGCILAKYGVLMLSGNEYTLEMTYPDRKHFPEAWQKIDTKFFETRDHEERQGSLTSVSQFDKMWEPVKSGILSVMTCTGMLVSIVGAENIGAFTGIEENALTGGSSYLGDTATGRFEGHRMKWPGKEETEALHLTIEDDYKKNVDFGCFCYFDWLLKEYCTKTLKITDQRLYPLLSLGMQNADAPIYVQNNLMRDKYERRVCADISGLMAESLNMFVVRDSFSIFRAGQVVYQRLNVEAERQKSFLQRGWDIMMSPFYRSTPTRRPLCPLFGVVSFEYGGDEDIRGAGIKKIADFLKQSKNFKTVLVDEEGRPKFISPKQKFFTIHPRKLLGKLRYNAIQKMRSYYETGLKDYDNDSVGDHEKTFYLDWNEEMQNEPYVIVSKDDRHRNYVLIENKEELDFNEIGGGTVGITAQVNKWKDAFDTEWADFLGNSAEEAEYWDFQWLTDRDVVASYSGYAMHEAGLYRDVLRPKFRNSASYYQWLPFFSRLLYKTVENWVIGVPQGLYNSLQAILRMYPGYSKMVTVQTLVTAIMFCVPSYLSIPALLTRTTTYLTYLVTAAVSSEILVKAAMQFISRSENEGNELRQIAMAGSISGGVHLSTLRQQLGVKNWIPAVAYARSFINTNKNKGAAAVNVTPNSQQNNGQGDNDGVAGFLSFVREYSNWIMVLLAIPISTEININTLPPFEPKQLFAQITKEKLVPLVQIYWIFSLFFNKQVLEEVMGNEEERRKADYDATQTKIEKYIDNMGPKEKKQYDKLLLGDDTATKVLAIVNSLGGRGTWSDLYSKVEDYMAHETMENIDSGTEYWKCLFGQGDFVTVSIGLILIKSYVETAEKFLLNNGNNGAKTKRSGNLLTEAGYTVFLLSSLYKFISVYYSTFNTSTTCQALTSAVGSLAEKTADLYEDATPDNIMTAQSFATVAKILEVKDESNIQMMYEVAKTWVLKNAGGDSAFDAYAYFDDLERKHPFQLPGRKIPWDRCFTQLNEYMNNPETNVEAPLKSITDCKVAFRVGASEYSNQIYEKSQKLLKCFKSHRLLKLDMTGPSKCIAWDYLKSEDLKTCFEGRTLPNFEAVPGCVGKGELELLFEYVGDAKDQAGQYFSLFENALKEIIPDFPLRGIIRESLGFTIQFYVGRYCENIEKQYLLLAHRHSYISRIISQKDQVECGPSEGNAMPYVWANMKTSEGKGWIEHWKKVQEEYIKGDNDPLLVGNMDPAGTQTKGYFIDENTVNDSYARTYTQARGIFADRDGFARVPGFKCVSGDEK